MGRRAKLRAEKTLDATCVFRKIPVTIPSSGEQTADHWKHREDDDYYSQRGLLFRLMTAEQKKALFENTARAMGDAPEEIKVRHIGNCMKADPAYGEGVAEALGISIGELAEKI